METLTYDVLYKGLVIDTIKAPGLVEAQNIADVMFGNRVSVELTK